MDFTEQIGHIENLENSAPLPFLSYLRKKSPLPIYLYFLPYIKVISDPQSFYPGGCCNLSKWLLTWLSWEHAVYGVRNMGTKPLLHCQLIIAVNCLDRKTELVRGWTCSPRRDTNHSGISAFRVWLLSASELSSAESRILPSWILFHFGKRWPLFSQNLLSQALAATAANKPALHQTPWLDIWEALGTVLPGASSIFTSDSFYPTGWLLL